MSDRAKKLEEKLQLRLLKVSEDPTFQGYRKENKKVFGSIIELDIERQREIEKSSSGSIH